MDFIGDILRNLSKIEGMKYPIHYTLIFFPFFMLINLSEDLHKMIVISMLGNILIINSTIMGIVYSFQKDNSNDWKIVSRKLYYYPRFFGFVFCSLSSPGLVSIREKQRKKEHPLLFYYEHESLIRNHLIFCYKRIFISYQILAIEHSSQRLWSYNKLYGLLNQCMTIITCIHLIVGIIGYIKCGSNVSENFIYNIQKDGDG